MCSVIVLGPGTAQAGAPLSIAVSGNHFVNGEGETVRLIGVDAPSTEYACDEGWGYSSQPLTAATASAIASWHADAVRVPLNEDCWLGVNGQPSYGTQAGYQQAIKTWVADLNAAGLYAIVDLHWSAPGTNNADGQRPMPDDHSVAFWSSVASTFQNDPAVVFDAFNEPFSPAADGDSALAVSWSCWLNGACSVPVAADGTTPNDNDTYSAVGMQAIVTGIRDSGATQPILLGGLSYANDLSGWLANEPVDPDRQLAASFHNYYGESCDSASCWNTTIASVAAKVPVVTGEFDQGYDCASTPTGPTSLTTFDNTYMNWADQNGVGYLAWGWWVLGNTSTTCSALGGGGDNYALISSYGGAPVAPDGTNLQSHLAALHKSTTTTLSSSQPAGSSYGQAVTFTATVAVGDSSEPTGSITFSVGSTQLGQPVALQAGVATLTTNATSMVLPAGTDTVTAAFSGSPGSGQLASSANVTQTVGANAPTISRVTPNSGAGAGGSAVRITGTNFTGASSVLFGTTNATAFRVNSATLITADSPVGVGTVAITVTTASGTSALSGVDQFTFLAPTVSSVAPTFGPAGGGAKVTITGSHLQGVSAVEFGSIPATSHSVNGAGTKITAYTPAQVPSTVDVTVTSPGGTSLVVTGDHYTYRPPTVSRVSPPRGLAGITVTITGSNFAGVTAVTVGSAAASFTVTGITRITAVVPPGSGVADVTVSTAVATSAIVPADHFSYT
jgi:hypothetical protein